MNLGANAGAFHYFQARTRKVSRHLWCLDWIYHGHPRSPSWTALFVIHFVSS